MGIRRLRGNRPAAGVTRAEVETAAGRAVAMSGPILVLSGLSRSVAEAIGRSSLRPSLAQSTVAMSLAPVTLLPSCAP